MGTTFTEGAYLGDLLKWEQEGDFSRTVATLTGAAALKMGTVLGKILTAGATVVAAGGNTGDGVLTVDATDPVLAGALVGDYIVECITAATNGGTFRVTAPNGYVLGDVAVGDTFADQIKFAIADGATDFAVGDTFTITAAEGSGKWTQLDPSATTGAEIAAGVLLADADPSSADVDALIMEGDSIMMPDYLIWPDGITAGEKATALENLKAVGIKTDRIGV